MSKIDDAIGRLVYHALATEYNASKDTVNYAPSYPPEDGTAPTPFTVTHIMRGTVEAQDASFVKHLMTIGVDFHIGIDYLKETYKQIDTIVPDFTKRLAGDPNLNGNVDTIVFPVRYEVTPSDWNGILTVLLRFEVDIKVMETPIT